MRADYDIDQGIPPELLGALKEHDRKVGGEMINRAKPEGIELEEISRQPYADSVLSAGLVGGCGPDTVYLRFERLAEDEEPTTILMRPDEALAVTWLLCGVLWSERIRDIA